jgi:hypothetical protein
MFESDRDKGSVSVEGIVVARLNTSEALLMRATRSLIKGSRFAALTITVAAKSVAGSMRNSFWLGVLA